MMESEYGLLLCDEGSFDKSLLLQKGHLTKVSSDIIFKYRGNSFKEEGVSLPKQRYGVCKNPIPNWNSFSSLLFGSTTNRVRKANRNSHRKRAIRCLPLWKLRNMASCTKRSSSYAAAVVLDTTWLALLVAPCGARVEEACRYPRKLRLG